MSFLLVLVGFAWGASSVWAYNTVKPLITFIGQKVSPYTLGFACAIPFAPVLVFIGKKYYEHKLKKFSKGDIMTEFGDIAQDMMRKI